MSKYLQKRLTPNAHISQEEWRRAKVLGTMATERLATIIGSAAFIRLPIRDQLIAIKMATDLAYKPMIVEDKVSQTIINMPGSANAMKALADQAQLPEMRQSQELQAAKKIN